MKLESRQDYQTRRHFRVRNKVSGTQERPRMCVFISNKHIYVQFVNDQTAATLASVSTLSEELKAGGKVNLAVAKRLGALAAQVAKAKGVEQVVFDRGGFKYHGRIKALAEAAREAGLKF